MAPTKRWEEEGAGKWASVRFWTTSTRAQLLWLDDWVLCGVPVEQWFVSTKSKPKRGNRKTDKPAKSATCSPKAHWSPWRAKATASGQIPVRMGLCWRWLVRVPALIPVHRLQHCQRACEHQDWTLVQRNKVVWSDESCEGMPGRRKRWHQETL